MTAYRSSFSFIPETPVLYDELTLEEHLKLTAMAYGVDEKQYEERVGQLLQEFRMKNRLKWFPSHFKRNETKSNDYERIFSGAISLHSR